MKEKIFSGNGPLRFWRAPDMKKKCYQNRELSWLQFNERVLEEVADADVPLGERLSFASIFQSNLDEFFMVRVGALYAQLQMSGNVTENKTNMTAKEQIAAVLEQVRKIEADRDRVYADIMSALADFGIEIINFSSRSAADAEFLEEYFNREIKPLLSPQIVGKRQPFPFLKNKEIYAVVAIETKNSTGKVGIVPCGSGMFDRLIPVPSDENRFMLAEELILHFAAQIFDRYKIKGKTLIRVIRSADIDAAPDDDIAEFGEDYRREMEKIIKKRNRLAPVKLELSRSVGDSVMKTLLKNLGISEKQAFFSSSPLDLSFTKSIRDALREYPELFFEKRVPQKPPLDEHRPMTEQIKERDILLSYPYESIKPFLRLLREASEDEDVVSIKITLYRVAKYSRVVEALINAAENGKEVVAVVELQARFDEENNIGWSRRLEEAGCRIIYGLDGFKVHSKLCLITKRQNNKIEYITQIGTGNYNESTAAQYTDYCLMTSSPKIGADVGRVFNELSMGQAADGLKHLLAAPYELQSGIIRMIDGEIAAAKSGHDAYIGIKMNSLTDKKIIDKLIEASRAGVKIELIVRGICCLVPQIEGYTENIRVISIVGRFLEHSRVYIFGLRERLRVYISSADLMTRNTVRRVEVAVPIRDRKLREQICGMFAIMMRDTVKAREKLADASYVRRRGGEKLNSQEYFYELAYQGELCEASAAEFALGEKADEASSETEHDGE